MPDVNSFVQPHRDNSPNNPLEFDEGKIRLTSGAGQFEVRFYDSGFIFYLEDAKDIVQKLRQFADSVEARAKHMKAIQNNMLIADVVL